jgi:hypothetical protein
MRVIAMALERVLWFVDGGFAIVYFEECGMPK